MNQKNYFILGLGLGFMITSLACILFYNLTSDRDVLSQKNISSYDIEYEQQEQNTQQQTEQNSKEDSDSNLENK